MNEHPLVRGESVLVARHDGVGLMSRKDLMAGLADHRLARHAEEGLRRAVDDDMAIVAGILHQDRGRDILDHHIEEIARPVELALGLQAFRLILEHLHQELRLVRRVAQDEPLDRDLALTLVSRGESILADRQVIAGIQRHIVARDDRVRFCLREDIVGISSIEFLTNVLNSPYFSFAGPCNSATTFYLIFAYFGIWSKDRTTGPR